MISTFTHSYNRGANPRLGGGVVFLERKPNADYLAVIITLAAALILATIIIFFQEGTSPVYSKASLLMIVLIGGFAVAVGFGMKIELDSGVERGELFVALLFGGLFLLAPVINWVTSGMPTDFELLTMLFALCAAVAEEWLFRGAIYMVIVRLVESLRLHYIWKITWFIAGSAIFVAFHGYVYGGSANTLLMVFIASMILYIMMDSQKSISVPIIMHVLWNFFAVLAAG